MLRSIAVAGLLASIAGVAGAQKPRPICIIDAVRHPATDCTDGRSPDDPAIAMPLDPTFRRVAQNNIEMIEVVKGVRATMLYGPDAIDGAIIITTKRGAAQAPAPDDPLARYFFAPELVMANQGAIALTDRQRSMIEEAIKDAQGQVVSLQFKMSGEVEKLQRLIQGVSVDQAKVLEQADRVLTIERDVKHAQLTLMIRVKNALTELQQKQLAKLRSGGAE